MGKTITITLSENLAKYLEQLANIEHQSLEEIVLTELDYLVLPEDDVNAIEEQLAVVSHFSDNRLWALVDRQLTSSQTHRLEKLTDRIKASQTLSLEEHKEHQTLLDRVEVYMLWRSAALAELKQRGYDVGRYVNA